MSPPRRAEERGWRAKFVRGSSLGCSSGEGQPQAIAGARPARLARAIHGRGVTPDAQRLTASGPALATRGIRRLPCQAISVAQNPPRVSGIFTKSFSAVWEAPARLLLFSC